MMSLYHREYKEEGGEEHELLEDIYSKQALEEEQAQGLLSNAAPSNVHNRRSWIARAKRPIIALLLGGLLIVLTMVLLVKQEVAVAQHDVAEALAIQSSDYILDSNWDFDAAPQRRVYDWVIRDQVHNPDGVYRPMLLVNNMFPGPLIEANDGDTIIVHVDNRASNATSIHWHGLFQNGTSHMDGTVGVSQCPIAPGTRYTYEFTIKGQHGTTWWHGHQGVQTSDGLHGPIVIHSPKEKELQLIPYDTDHVIMLSDHYHDLSSDLLFEYLKPDMENAEPVPESGLINGRNIRSCDDYPHRKCDNTTSNVGVPEFVLEKGMNHRLRLINVGAFAEFQFQIDEHELAVTEVDGTDVHPRSYHRLNINPAQRYSVILRSNVSSAATFWMRARMIGECFTDPPPTLQTDATAIVRYSAEATFDAPTSRDWEEKLALECRDMNTIDLAPVESISAPDEPDAVYYIRSNFEIGAFRLSRGFFNATSWRTNARSPSLMRAVDGIRAENETFMARTNTASADDGGAVFVNDNAFDINRELVIQTTGIQTIDVLVSNFDDGNHPLHLHGYRYFVLAQGHGAPPLTRIDAAINRESLAPLYAKLNTTNPLRRDTASVEAYGWILLRFVADNPGAWAFHCHVSWHAEAGLLMQFLTRTDELAKIEIPQSSLDLCTAEGLEKGMGPDDGVYEDLAK